jgi:carboxypeptidase Taq
MSFQKLDDLGHKLEALEHALAILGADEATHMAVGGGEKRAEAMAALAGMYHTRATAPEIADWIAAAEQETLGEEQRAAVKEFRQYHQPDLPARRIRRAADDARMRSEQLWRDLRAKNDWAASCPRSKAWSCWCARGRCAPMCSASIPTTR